MKIEIPKFTRCCCCLPLRRGIIVLGYLSLAIASFIVYMEHVVFEEAYTDQTRTTYRGASFIVHKWLAVLMHCVEMAFFIVLLVGAHTKRRHLMRIYFYYGITTCAASIAIYFLVALREEPHWSLYLIDICSVFSGLVTQLYLLLLIYSYLEKPRDSISRNNHLAEVIAQRNHNLV